MLRIAVPLGVEQWDEEKEEFIEPPHQILQLEHSLVSLSKWESKWGKVFFSKDKKTYEETLDYIRCMTVTPNVNPSVYSHLTSENIDQVNEYISEPMTATTFSKDENGKRNNEVVTAEIIYYWMIALNIPMECQKWHLNRLFTLVRVCNIKNTPPKKRSMKERMNSNRALNEARRKKLNTRG